MGNQLKKYKNTNKLQMFKTTFSIAVLASLAAAGPTLDAATAAQIQEAIDAGHIDDEEAAQIHEAVDAGLIDHAEVADLVQDATAVGQIQGLLSDYNFHDLLKDYNYGPDELHKLIAELADNSDMLEELQDSLSHKIDIATGRASKFTAFEGYLFDYMCARWETNILNTVADTANGWTEQFKALHMLKDAAGNYTSLDWSTFDGYAESKCEEADCADNPGLDKCVGPFSVNGASAGANAIASLCVSAAVLVALN